MRTYTLDLDEDEARLLSAMASYAAILLNPPRYTPRQALKQHLDNVKGYVKDADMVLMRKLAAKMSVLPENY